MESLADEDQLCFKIFHFKCVYVLQPVSKIPYVELLICVTVQLKPCLLTVDRIVSWTCLTKISDNSNNALFFECRINFQPLSCQYIDSCFARADNDKMRAANESYALK